MRRFLPDAIAGRVLLAMVLALLISNMLGIAIYVSEHENSANLVGNEHVSERIVTLFHLINNAPTYDQAEIVSYADKSTIQVTLDTAPTVSRTSPDSPEENLLRQSFRRYLGRHDEVDFRLEVIDAEPEILRQTTREVSPNTLASSKILHISLQLSHGEWVNFSTVVLQPPSIWSLRFILSMLVATVSVIVVSVIVIRRINIPLRRFAYAAERLGTNIDSPPLPASGPKEVRQAIEAFNGMQRRINRLLEDRRQILAAVSHDLRTPITLLRLRAERIDDRAEKQKLLETLDEMELMVSSILEFARLDAAKETVRKVDLAALIRTLCDDIADVGRQVAYRGPDRLAYECRPAVLRRALGNLIDNAIKYGDRARIQLAEGADEIAITIDDDGPGISGQELENVFMPFYRADRSRLQQPTGVGLGLSVARQVISTHGGEIRIANREAGGLRVTVSLPVLPTPSG